MPTILLMLILFVDDDAETVSFYPYSEQNVHECVTVASSLNRRLDRIRDLRNDDVVDHELGKVWRFRNVDASNVDDARFECDVVSVEPRPSRATTERAQQEHEALLGRIAALAQEEQLRQPTVEELTTPARKSRKQAQRPEEEAPAAASKASLAGLPAADQAWVRSSCAGTSSMGKLRRTGSASDQGWDAGHLRVSRCRPSLDPFELFASAGTGSMGKLRRTGSASDQGWDAGHLRASRCRPSLDPFELLASAGTGSMGKLHRTGSPNVPRHTVSIGKDPT